MHDDTRAVQARQAAIWGLSTLYLVRMAPTDTETRPITVKGRTYQTSEVSPTQVVVMLRIEAAMRRLQRVNDLNTNPQALGQAKSLATRACSVVAGCFADPDDWQEIEEMMALREITWEEVLDIISQVGKAWSDEEVPSNRTAKRAAAKKAVRA